MKGSCRRILHTLGIALHRPNSCSCPGLQPIISHMMACQTHHLIVVEVGVGKVVVVLQTLRLASLGSSLRCNLTKGVSCIPTLCKVTP